MPVLFLDSLNSHTQQSDSRVPGVNFRNITQKGLLLPEYPSQSNHIKHSCRYKATYSDVQEVINGGKVFLKFQFQIPFPFSTFVAFF